MRTLVVGTVPPPGGPSARALAAVAAERVEAGDVVEVLSPDPSSASHYQGTLVGVLLPIRLALVSRRFDALELRIESRLPFDPTVGRLTRAITLTALGAVLALYDDVTIRLDSPVPIPGGVGGRAAAGLWSRARRIVVENAADRDQLLVAPGISADRVVVVETAAGGIGTRGATWPSADEIDLRTRVLAIVRQRAADERLANSARVDLGVVATGPVASTAFSVAGRTTSETVAIAQAAATRGLRIIKSAVKGRR